MSLDYINHAVLGGVLASRSKPFRSVLTVFSIFWVNFSAIFTLPKENRNTKSFGENFYVFHLLFCLRAINKNGTILYFIS